MTRQQNNITDVTRQQIADEMSLSDIAYYGTQTQPDFLSRLFNLKVLPSPIDRRFDNAYDDIYQHTVNNYDWEEDWIYHDPRINLFHSDDETYMKFLALTIHPRVRTNDNEVTTLLKIYNKYLGVDDFEIIKTDEISGKAVYSCIRKTLGQAQLAAKKTEIKKYLNTSYVNGKIHTMTEAIDKDTDLAIGTAKELLETTCKSILKQKSESIDEGWTLPQLLKATTNKLDFKPKEAQDSDKAEKAIKQILGGISSIVQGVSELRNTYGTGHGKDADFKGLETKYAKLLVGVVSEVAILYLATNGEAELIQ